MSFLAGNLRLLLVVLYPSSLTAGSVFNRSIKYRDDSLGKVGIKNGLYTELRVDMVI